MFEISFDEYLKDVKSQLTCNASGDYKSKYITYDYSEEEVNNNLNHFKGCYNQNISGYKALLFLSEI